MLSHFQVTYGILRALKIYFRFLDKSCIIYQWIMGGTVQRLDTNLSGQLMINSFPFVFRISDILLIFVGIKKDKDEFSRSDYIVYR